MSKPAITWVVDRYDLRANRAGYICCPVHEERQPSCQLFADWWYCHGCGANGDSLGLIAAVTKRPLADVLREFSENTPTWRRASKQTEHLNPQALTVSVLRAYRAVHSWFFKTLAARTEGAPDWLLLRLAEYWGEVFDDTKQKVMVLLDKKRRPEAEALVRGLRDLAERGLGIEAESWQVTEAGLWGLRHGLPVEDRSRS